MDIAEKVMTNLKSFGLDTNIKANTLKHLVKIDEVLDTMMQAQINAIQKIKNDKISINRIAKESKIARQTFYNNPIITAYIEHYLSAYIEINPYDTIESLRDKIRWKDTQIAGLVQRDATISKYKAENQELTDEIASLQATIKSQDDLIKKLRQNSISRIK